MVFIGNHKETVAILGDLYFEKHPVVSRYDKLVLSHKGGKQTTKDAGVLFKPFLVGIMFFLGGVMA